MINKFLIELVNGVQLNLDYNQLGEKYESIITDMMSNFELCAKISDVDFVGDTFFYDSEVCIPYEHFKYLRGEDGVKDYLMVYLEAEGQQDTPDRGEIIINDIKYELFWRKKR